MFEAAAGCVLAPVSRAIGVLFHDLNVLRKKGVALALIIHGPESPVHSGNFLCLRARQREIPSRALSLGFWPVRRWGRGRIAVAARGNGGFEQFGFLRRQYPGLSASQRRIDETRFFSHFIPNRNGFEAQPEASEERAWLIR